MARLRSVHYEDIQLGILAKAAELFGTKGYERSSIADLTEACSLSRGALYHYFSSKESILFAMLDAHVRELLERLEDAVTAGGTPVEQLTRVIETVVDYNAGSPHQQVVLLNDLASLGASEQRQIVKLQQQIVDLVAGTLVRIDSGGKITRSTCKVYTMMLFGIINYTYTWYDPTGGIKPKQLAQMATDLLLKGLQSGVASGATEPFRKAGAHEIVAPLRRRAAQR
jgi:AcrR family transcriptional regulator